MLRFLIGLLVGVLATLATPLVLFAAGLVDLGAEGGAGAVEETLGHWAYERWVETHAQASRTQTAPPTEESWEAGLALYEQACVACHGAPDVDPAPWATTMVPAPPDVAHAAEELSEAELYLVIERGVRLTGMPAFADLATPTEIGQLVRFVRDIEGLTPDQKARLRKATRPASARPPSGS